MTAETNDAHMIDDDDDHDRDRDHVDTNTDTKGTGGQGISLWPIKLNRHLT
jgi:hypothetical protein